MMGRRGIKKSPQTKKTHKNPHKPSPLTNHMLYFLYSQYPCFSDTNTANIQSVCAGLPFKKKNISRKAALAMAGTLLATVISTTVEDVILAVKFSRLRIISLAL